MPLVKPPTSKTVEKLFKISQNEPMIFYLFIFLGGPLDYFTGILMCRKQKMSQICLKSRKIDL